MSISQKHAGVCFAVVGGFTLLVDLFLLAAILFMLYNGPDGGSTDWLSVGLFFSATFLLSGICGWTAWSLARDRPKAGLLATIVWIVMAPPAIYLSVTAFHGVRSPYNLLAAIVYVGGEALIAVHLLQRRHGTTT